ncbi:MAG: 60S ribosomal protein L31 [Candidatus Bathyarchaeota archaeon]|nr:60S ribosomal protein L31 [Candidatus Bathyarchaeota archaeon]MDH5712585.1 60S ribosomal protein L31 [Candidatus Bathyarchaeota archaeon]
MKQTAEESEKTEELKEPEDTAEVEETGEVEEPKETEEIIEEEEEIVEEAVEEVKKPKRKEIEEEIVEEKIYTIPLGRAWISPRKKRAPRATRILKNFLHRYMKIKTEAEEGEETERLVVSNEVNEKIWSRGIEKPPRKIRVRAVKDKEGVITVYLAEGD